MLLGSSVIIIHKSFFRPHLDYEDTVHYKPANSSLSNKIEPLQYNAALAISDAIRVSSKESMYQELSFESLKDCTNVKHIFPATQASQLKKS